LSFLKALATSLSARFFKYVGVSTQTLRKRMGGYISPGPKSTTNILLNRNIREQLANDVAVEVYALPDTGLMHYGPFHLNLASGLEGSIIATLNPAWNIAARSQSEARRAAGDDTPAVAAGSRHDTGEKSPIQLFARRHRAHRHHHMLRIWETIEELASNR
jgi:hypothetical protein